MVKRYGEDAATEAVLRANELLAEGDMDGCVAWKRIMHAAEELLAMEPVDNKLN